MMDYKKAYYSLIERLKEAKADEDICDERYCCVIDGLVQEPEENERIRKAISQCVEDMRGQFEKLYSVHHKDAITWLEKQGTPAKLSEEEQNRFAKGVLSSCALSFIDYLEAHKYEGKMCVSNGECKDIENAFQNAMWDRLHRYYCKYIERQANKPQGKSALKAIHEQKVDNANKVEREFKVGDWIVNQHGTVRHIEEVGNVGYQTDEGWLTHDCYEKDFRLWSITDAKDGDILYSLDSKQPFIYKNRKPFNQTEAYCGINIFGKFFVWNTKDCVITLDKYVPATKEQRDTLIKVMTDAGYVFNFEKKELKKINSYCEKHCKGYQETGKCFSDGDCEAKIKAEQKLTCSEKKLEEVETTDSEIKGMENVRQELLEHCYKQAEMYDNLITGNIYRKIQSWIDWLKKQGERNDYKYSPLYIRFGDIPQEEKSTIYCGEEETGCENGVSVYPAFIDINGNIVCGLTLPITKTTLYTQQHLFEYDNRPCYLVTGDYVGKGSDGEPLINNVKILRRITEYRVKGLKNESENKGKERGISPNS